MASWASHPRVHVLPSVLAALLTTTAAPGVTAGDGGSGGVAAAGEANRTAMAASIAENAGLFFGIFIVVVTSFW